MRNFQIPPKVGIWVFTVVTVIAAGGAAIIPDYVPAGLAHGIVQTCILIVAVVSGSAAASHVFANSTPGPLAPQDPPIVKAVADGASPKTILALAQDLVNASPAPSAATEPNSPLQPKG